jgi:hypothetical protein
METTFETHNLKRNKDHHLAGLLGLDVSEYRRLSHSGFRTITGLDGKPMHFYTVVSPLNPKPILDRLKPKMNKYNTIYIPAETLRIKDLPEDTVV